MSSQGLMPSYQSNFDVEFLMALLTIFISGFALFYVGVPFVARAFF